MVIARLTRLIAPISLGLAGLLLLILSSPPWFNALWGEESGVSWSGIALAVPQILLAAFMLRGSGVATVLGATLAAGFLLLNILLLFLSTDSPRGTEVFATASALYALVIAGVLVDTWRHESPAADG
jgi:ABC-type transport system involved in cytochrome c biogenesis permease subunit